MQRQLVCNLLEYYIEPLNSFYKEKWQNLTDLERSRQDVPQINVDQLKDYGTATQIVANREKETSIMQKDGWLKWAKDAKMSTSRLPSTLNILCTIQ